MHHKIFLDPYSSVFNVYHAVVNICDDMPRVYFELQYSVIFAGLNMVFCHKNCLDLSYLNEI